MCAVVADLADCEQGDAEICQERVRRFSSRAVRTVAPVCQVEARENPVVAAVLEDVHDGHRGR